MNPTVSANDVADETRVKNRPWNIYAKVELEIIIERLWQLNYGVRRIASGNVLIFSSTIYVREVIMHSDSMDAIISAVKRLKQAV